MEALQASEISGRIRATSSSDRKDRRSAVLSAIGDSFLIGVAGTGIPDAHLHLRNVPGRDIGNSNGGRIERKRNRGRRDFRSSRIACSDSARAMWDNLPK